MSNLLSYMSIQKSLRKASKWPYAHMHHREMSIYSRCKFKKKSRCNLIFHHGGVNSSNNSVEMIYEQFTLIYVHAKVAEKGLKMLICTICTTEKFRFIVVENSKNRAVATQISSCGCLIAPK